MRTEVDILNRYFVSESGENLVEFVYKDLTYYDADNLSQCSLLFLSNIEEDTESRDWRNAVNNCQNSDVVDPKAINFFIYDAWNSDKEFESVRSLGKFNDGKPYVILDWWRLGHNHQSPEEHEMGHAFGLEHICDPSVTTNDMSSNIMTSANKYTDANGNEGDCSDDTNGRGGLRDIGFNDEQVDEILRNAVAINYYLNLIPTP